MRIPNYDVEDDVVSNFRQLYDFTDASSMFPDAGLRSKWFRENKHINAYDLQYAVF